MSARSVGGQNEFDLMTKYCYLVIGSGERMFIPDNRTFFIEDVASGSRIKAAGLRGPGGRSDGAAPRDGMFASPYDDARSLLLRGDATS
jgi:hypothetical protein